MAERTILVVEDTAADVFQIRHSLSKACPGVRIHVADDVDQALAYLSGRGDFADRRRHPLPFLIVMDLSLPRRVGFDLLEWLARDERLSRIPKVVLTASSLERDVERAYALGTNSYVLKRDGGSPLSFDETVGWIGRWWGRMNVPE